jgi:oligopeptide/dipeptide ABC transporter, ATP-binding protein, C-terminal domain
LQNGLLTIEHLTASFHISDRYYAAVDDVSLTVRPNEILAVVGESGSGKSALALSVMGLHTRARIEGSIRFEGQELTRLPAPKLNRLRGREMGMIFQDPMSALNPLMVIGDQIEEALVLHRSGMSKRERKAKVVELLAKVGIAEPEHAARRYPHELSGGMRQRVVIAIAVANEPKLLIADEPTTALDATIQLQILELIRKLKRDSGAGVILITHDVGIVAEMADRVAVMYAGQIVEIADIHTLLTAPGHPYTRSLLRSIPSADHPKSKLYVIQGVVPSLDRLPRQGCRFRSRIPWIGEGAHEDEPAMHEIAPGHFVRCTCYRHFYFPDEEGTRHGAS